MARAADQVIAVVVTVLGLAVLRQASELPYREEYGPGPGFFPLWIGVLFVVLGPLLALQTMRPSKATPEADSLFTVGVLARVAAIAGSILVAVVLVRPLGLLLSLGLLVVFLLRVLERKPWRLALACGLIAMVGLRLVFGIWLGVPFPLGILGV